MKIKRSSNLHYQQLLPLCFSILLSISLFGCGSGSDDNSTGYIQLYNLSANAPGVYLTVDQYDDDDYDENTHSPILFSKVSSYLTYERDTYDIELAWQNEYNNVYDLEIVHQNQLQVEADTVQFIVVTDDIRAPEVLYYELPVRDSDELEEDTDDEVFNIRVLNMNSLSDKIDMYYSESHETFNEAVLLSETTFKEMSVNHKIAQDGYNFYLTNAGSNDVLFTSEDIDFPYASEYIMVIRDNTGVGSSPFLLDIISTSSITEYSDTNSEASYRIFNAIIEHEQLADYNNSFDFHINGIDDSPEVASLNFGEFSQSFVIDSGDYSMNLVEPTTQNALISNHLLSLNENTDKTVFFYLLEEAVDEDEDGDIDENGDGFIDNTEIVINSLVVENSLSNSIYSHQMNVINLIDQDEFINDFSSIKVYFVRSDEDVDTADQSLTAIFAQPSSVNLLNNTYTVYVIGSLDSSEIILSSSELTLNEDSKDQFIILEKVVNTNDEYTMRFENQVN